MLFFLRTIYQIFGTDAKEMTLSLLQAQEIKSKIPTGASIMIKPNLVVAKSADSGATTHPEILEGLFVYLMENGFTDLFVAEGSWVGDQTMRACRAAGHDEVLKRFNIPFYDLKKDKAVPVKTAIGEMKICQRALEADYLINLPVLKGHCQTHMTCALKNLKGCLPDSEKRRFHALGLHEPIAALSAVLKPQMTIVDSLCGDLNFEEGGTPINTNRMLLGFDPVQMDAFGCRLMGIPAEDVPYIRLAERFGAGNASFKESDIVSLNSPKAAAAYKTKSGIVGRLTRSVSEKDACSACFGNLVHALYRSELEGTSVARPIAVGQGWRDKPFEGLGIGRCCARALKHVPGCPPSAEEIQKALKE